MVIKYATLWKTVTRHLVRRLLLLWLAAAHALSHPLQYLACKHWILQNIQRLLLAARQIQVLKVKEGKKLGDRDDRQQNSTSTCEKGGESIHDCKGKATAEQVPSRRLWLFADPLIVKIQEYNTLKTRLSKMEEEKKALVAVKWQLFVLYDWQSCFTSEQTLHHEILLL